MQATDGFDPVNRPAHYNKGEIECIDAIRVAISDETDPFVAYCRGNTMKYTWRSGSKLDAAEDLRKAAWYATKAADHLDSQRAE